MFAQAAGAPVKLTTGPGGDLYYVDYGFVNNRLVDAGAGGHPPDLVRRRHAVRAEVVARRR